MRDSTNIFLSDYLSNRLPLQRVREFIEAIDWDDPDISEDERLVILKIEAYLAGIDEELNDETGLRAWLFDSTPVLLTLWSDSPPTVLSIGSNDSPQSTGYTVFVLPFDETIYISNPAALEIS